jgi:6-phosphogluconolactonase
VDNIRIYQNPEDVTQAAADYLSEKIGNCVAARGVCHVVLPGGRTPAHCLELLAVKSLPWQQIHWYPGDERCYPVGHADRNDTMILAKLFSRAESGRENFHPIPAELGAEPAARQYAQLLDETGTMDIVVLGMGEDGHTASLFPGNATLADQRSAVAVYDAPKPPPERVSIGLASLKNAADRIVIATGENKSEALVNVSHGKLLPVSLIEPDIWFIDAAAASGITGNNDYE